jgi:spermidine/putrescine-binding protein
MSPLDRQITRRDAVKLGAVGAFSLTLAACGSSSSGGGTSGGKSPSSVNWLTWADHYSPAQLAAVEKQTGTRMRPSLFSDNAEALLKLKQPGAPYDIVSADALWVPRYLEEGLIVPFDLQAIPASSELYSIAREFPFWQDAGKYMAYPYGWSTQQIYYNTAKVTTKPDSWQALADPKYRKRIVLLNSPTDMMAMAGLATGVTKPYEMADAEIARAKAFLGDVKPNVLKLASQNSDINAALVDGSAWLAYNNIGTDVLVKEAGGPDIGVTFPKEGTVGFIDGEMIVKSSKTQAAFPKLMDKTERAKWLAESFLKNGHPLFNEAAYKVLVDQGHKERADKFFYNEPNKALETNLKGPSKNEQAYVDAFNEVFGA